LAEGLRPALGFARQAFHAQPPGVAVGQLNELEEMGIVRKVVYPVVPMKVEYFLTELGNSLVPIIRMMDDWGNKHRYLAEQNQE
ncbi:winged helix-turn-helix transcriptional regulator, partial [Paraprevotella clara]|uniref:winged helix-turn-helix transcriptional regulator n=1 Tax=Paraprevotella clara TaxID=454154 RepID=UPI003AF85EF7